MGSRSDWDAELRNARIESVHADGWVVIRYGNGLTRKLRVSAKALASFRRLMAFDRVERELAAE